MKEIATNYIGKDGVRIDKETQLVEMKDMPILKDIKVIKIDSKTKEIIKEKFSFGIYEDEECNNF